MECKHKNKHKYRKNLIINIGKQWTTHFRDHFWHQRMQKKHGKDFTSKIQSERFKLCQEVTMLYEKQHQVMQQDQHVFNMPLATRLEGSIRTLKDWISCYKPLITHSTQQARTFAAAFSQPITKFLTRKSNKHATPQKTTTIASNKKKATSTNYITRYFPIRNRHIRPTSSAHQGLNQKNKQRELYQDHPV